MRKGLITAVAVVTVAAATFATPINIVEEDFEGTQFPPTGWSITRVWSRRVESGNHYAYGESYYPIFFSALVSYPFSLEKGVRLKIRFRYKNGYTGNPTFWTTSVRLIKGEPYLSVWFSRLALCPNWGLFSYYTEYVTETRNDYRVGWTVETRDRETSGWLAIDDVLVTRDTLGVEITSLGRVKALYR